MAGTERALSKWQPLSPSSRRYRQHQKHMSTPQNRGRPGASLSVALQSRAALGQGPRVSPGSSFFPSPSLLWPLCGALSTARLAPPGGCLTKMACVSAAHSLPHAGGIWKGTHCPQVSKPQTLSAHALRSILCLAATGFACLCAGGSA